MSKPEEFGVLTKPNIRPTLGGDPEFFIYNREANKKIQVVSADKVLQSKKNPIIIPNGSLFFDGVQAEINPVQHTCREFFINNIYKCLMEVYKLSVNKYPNILFVPLASIKIHKNDIKDADMECTRFGCSPDLNIYTQEKIDYPDGKIFMNRFSGGHIHIGFDDLDIHKKMSEEGKLLNLLKLLDVIPGIMSVAISPGKEEKIRKDWYGKAGTYRNQPHGIEYRTLSSYWMVSPPMASLVLGLVRDAVVCVYNGLDTQLLSNINQEEVRKIIDTHDVSKAKKFYFDVLKPFYGYKPIDNSPMYPEVVIEFVDDLVKNGYQKYFNPFKMLSYWDVLDKNKFIPQGFKSSFGIYSFASLYKTNKEYREIVNEINKSNI